MTLGVLLVTAVGLVAVLSSAHDPPQHYTNRWAVKVAGGPEEADRLAKELGYRNLGQLRGFQGTYIFQKTDHPHRSKRDAQHLTRRLEDDTKVVWAEQQFARPRAKRGVLIHENPKESAASKKTDSRRFNDELWKEQWYLHDTREARDIPDLDHRITKAWDLGFTGNGIVVSILDDGLEWNHTDIYKNYDPKASWDVNDDDPDPFPRYDDFDTNRHGTRCAGEVAMVAGNKKCGVGVAYDAKIGGVRLLDGDVTDAVEALSISHSLDHVDIFSASWGPNDDGMTVDGPKHLATEAFEKGIRQGRGGKGVIYVWASGNGGSKGDNCNCDGYMNSIYTLSVGSATQQGAFPWYGEKCASTLAVTSSSGETDDQKISSTDLHNRCTDEHTGTSASAPLAAGIFALVLQANQNLTWRDLQHLVVWTSDYEPVRKNEGWKRNSAGLLYNSKFGFGVLNAEKLIRNAIGWKTVPDKSVFRVNSISKFPMKLSSGGQVEALFVVDEKAGNEIRYLEHVQVLVTIKYSRRGLLDAFLVSPSGSVTVLLAPRKLDYSSVGFKNWSFLSVHLWGEDPNGQWKLVIRDKHGKDQRGSLESAELILHGTKEQPEHTKKGPKQYEGSAEEIDQALDRNPEYDETNDADEDDEDKTGKVFNWGDLVSKDLKQVSQAVEDEENDYSNLW